jgi:hypothetical protein
MTVVAERAASIIDKLTEKEQGFAINFLNQLFEIHESERQERNEAYLAKLRRGVRQVAEGRTIERDIIEVKDDE